MTRYRRRRRETQPQDVMNYQHRPVSELPLSPPGPAGSSSCRPDSPAHRRYEGAARLTWPRACPPAEGRRPVSATPPRRCCRRSGTSAPGSREFFRLRKAPDRRPRRAKDAARPRIIELRAGRATRSTRSPPRLAAEGTPLNRDRDRRGDRRAGTAPDVAPPRGPAWRPGPGGPDPRPKQTDFAALPGLAENAGWPGCSWPSRTWSRSASPDLVTAAGYPSTPEDPRPVLPAVPGWRSS